MENPPDQLRTAAIVQLVIGIIDFTIGWWLASMVAGGVGCVLTSPCMCLGLPPIGWLCSMVGLAMFPIGLVEIVAGIMGLTNPKSGGTFMKVAAIIGMCGIFAGGLTSLVGGAIAFMQLQSPEVKAYLE